MDVCQTLKSTTEPYQQKKSLKTITHLKGDLDYEIWQHNNSYNNGWECLIWMLQIEHNILEIAIVGAYELFINRIYQIRNVDKSKL